MISKSSEEYLKTIYILNKQLGEIRVTDIANKMNCSKPNVTKHLNILSDSKLIVYESYGKIELTDKGIKKSKEILEAEDIIYLLLNDVLCINNDNVRKDSSAIKSVISNETLDSISNYVYVKLGLDKLNCNFNMKNEKCRDCVMTRNSNGGK